MTWYTLIGAAWVGCGLVFIGWLAWQVTRPFTEMDAWCSAVDEQLDRAEEKQRHLRVVAAWDEAGDQAGAIVFEFPKVPSTTSGRGLLLSSTPARVDGRTADGGATSEPASSFRRSLPQRHFGGWSA